MQATQTGSDDASYFSCGQLSPGDHVVQIYECEDAFLGVLESFVVDGLNAGEAVVLIMTPEHAALMPQRLAAAGVDEEAERRAGNYLVLDAASTLAKFTTDGWPDEDDFRATVTDVLRSVNASERKVRAFGEMVAVLWSKGHNAATVRLERLWHDLTAKERFSLFCAYPRAGFNDYSLSSLATICDLHTAVLKNAA